MTNTEHLIIETAHRMNLWPTPRQVEQIKRTSERQFLLRWEDKLSGAKNAAEKREVTKQYQADYPNRLDFSIRAVMGA